MIKKTKDIKIMVFVDVKMGCAYAEVLSNASDIKLVVLNQSDDGDLVYQKKDSSQPENYEVAIIEKTTFGPDADDYFADIEYLEFQAVIDSLEKQKVGAQTDVQRLQISIDALNQEIATVKEKQKEI